MRKRWNTDDEKHQIILRKQRSLFVPFREKMKRDGLLEEVDSRKARVEGSRCKHDARIRGDNK